MMSNDTLIHGGDDDSHAGRPSTASTPLTSNAGRRRIVARTTLKSVSLAAREDFSGEAAKTQD
jgi:hypothetical protein